MNVVKQYLLTLLAVAAFLAVIFGISKYYGEEMAVPAISYASAEVRAENVVSPDAIDLNSASAEELEALEGIGPATAEKIIGYREKYGAFYSVDELTYIDGIGEAKLSAIKDMIYVSDQNVRSMPVMPPEDLTENTETEKIISSFPLDLNTASADELVLIDGIGKATAGKIISYRDEHGLSSVDELLNVKGIGKKTLESIRPYVTVNVSERTVLFESETETSYKTETASENIYPININTASEEELMSLDGVGEVIASRIREYAATTGFETVDDLINVKGIGEKTLEKLRPYVTV